MSVRSVAARGAVRTAALESFAQLSKLSQRQHGLTVRIQQFDGSATEGEVLSIADADIFVADDATGRNVQVFAREVAALDVRMPRSGRLRVLALLAIPAVVGYLVAFTQLPLPFPDRALAMLGFGSLFAFGWMLYSRRSVRRFLEARLTTWQRLFP